MGVEENTGLGADTPWSSTGYVTEIGYLRQYMGYQSPVGIAFAAASNGYAFPDPAAPFAYCDLGCGEAVTTLTLAAAYPHGRFVGVDLNPDHISRARDLANRAGLTNVTFMACDFADPAILAHGPFDFMAAHGVYTWVAPSVQRDFHALVDAALRPGGLVYFCHYVRPGSAMIETVFQLIQGLMADKTGPVKDRAILALADLRALQSQGAPLFTRHSAIDKFIGELEQRDHRYLVHEFGNRFFSPRFFSQVAQDFRNMGCHYVGTTHFGRNDLEYLFPGAVPGALQGLPPALAQERASVLTIDKFRWDVFRRSDGIDDQRIDRADRLAGFYLDAPRFPYSHSKQAKIWDKDIQFDAPMLNALGAVFQGGQMTIGQGLSDARLATFAPDVALRNLLHMVGAGNLVPSIAPAGAAQASSPVALAFSHPFYKALADRDLLAEGHLTLPSRHSGTTIGLDGFAGMATQAHDGRSTPQAMAHLRAWLGQLGPAEAQKVHAQLYQSDADFDAAWQKYLRTKLPLLRKHGILRPQE